MEQGNWIFNEFYQENVNDVKYLYRYQTKTTTVMKYTTYCTWIHSQRNNNKVSALACITQYDMMKNWGWDNIYRQGGLLAGPPKWNLLSIISILKWILTKKSSEELFTIICTKIDNFNEIWTNNKNWFYSHIKLSKHNSSLLTLIGLWPWLCDLEFVSCDLWYLIPLMFKIHGRGMYTFKIMLKIQNVTWWCIGKKGNTGTKKKHENSCFFEKNIEKRNTGKTRQEVNRIF